MKAPLHLVASAWLAAAGLSAQYFTSLHTESRRVTHATWQGASGQQSVTIEYGQPKWRAEHEQFVTSDTTGTVMLGSGALTTLRTDVELTFDNQKLAPGRYYLSLRRTERDAWWLAIFDVDRADRSNRGTTAVFVLEPKLRVPIKFTRADPVVAMFDIALQAEQRHPDKLAIALAWGPFRVRVPFVGGFDRRTPTDAPAFVLTPEGKGTKTASGLVFEILKPGEGDHPTAGDTVDVHYSGWLTDGTLFDTTYLHGQTARFPLQAVVAGFAEGLQLMKPGATARLTIPPQLAYGERGAGELVPPDATLVFTVTLVRVEGR